MNNLEAERITVQVDEVFKSIVDEADITACAVATLAHENDADASLCVTITDDDTIQALNAHYRGIDSPTDVLSFGNAPDDADGQLASDFVLPDEFSENEGAYLGDILIALPYCERQAERYRNSLQSELRLMTVHGTLHLLGYDHDTHEAEIAMWKSQAAVLHLLGEGELAKSVDTRDYGG